MWGNWGFPWPEFSRIRTESTVLFLSGNPSFCILNARHVALYGCDLKVPSLQRKKSQRSIIALMNLTTEDLITWLCCIIHFFRFLLFLFLTLSFLFFIDIFNYLSAQHLFRRTTFKREQKKFSKFSRQYPQLVRLPYNGSSFQK